MKEKKKAHKNVSASFKEEVSGMSKEEIHLGVVDCEKAIREIKKEIKEDKRITETRELLKFLLSSFNEVKKREEDKKSFLLEKLEEFYPNTEVKD